MPARRRRREAEDVSMNMTPMIDIVFQLVIFFMVVTDMSQQQLESVILPKAEMAKEDNPPPKDRVIVNVCHNMEKYRKCPNYRYWHLREKRGEAKKLCRDPNHWEFRVKGRKYNPRQLQEKLREAGIRYVIKEKGITRCDLPIQIRADAFAPWEMVQKVLQACSLLGIWKIDIGAAKPASR
jgi:biopolymer transport protein ExbD